MNSIIKKTFNLGAATEIEPVVREKIEIQCEENVKNNGTFGNFQPIIITAKRKMSMCWVSNVHLRVWESQLKIWRKKLKENYFEKESIQFFQFFKTYSVGQKKFAVESRGFVIPFRAWNDQKTFVVSFLWNLPKFLSTISSCLNITIIKSYVIKKWFFLLFWITVQLKSHFSKKLKTLMFIEFHPRIFKRSSNTKNGTSWCCQTSSLTNF